MFWQGSTFTGLPREGYEGPPLDGKAHGWESVNRGYQLKQTRIRSSVMVRHLQTGLLNRREWLKAVGGTPALSPALAAEPSDSPID